ncbi:MAG: hypothetical protein F4Y50_06440 [Dehalococcoidia bacterium]|nr:hypothetical protein [Dehalococcoidia bacterium]
MTAQFVDWGTLLTLLGLLGSVVGLAVGLLWRAIVAQMKMLHERFDKQDGRFDKQDLEMAELRSDVGDLQKDMAVVKNDLSYLKPRSERTEAAIVQIMRDVGRLKGEKRSASLREKVGAGGS